MISITDGQIFLSTDLFNSGVRPAINVGLSVSRVGGAAQVKAMKQVAGTLRLDLAQYREKEAFAQFGSDLDQATQKQLQRGQRLVEILKQPQYQPMPWVDQAISIFAATNGFLDDQPINKLGKFESEFLTFIQTNKADLRKSIEEKEMIDETAETELKSALNEFAEAFSAENSST